MERATTITLRGKSVKVVLKSPKTIQNGVVLYGQVLSFSDDKRFYPVAKRRTGTGRFSYRCGCDASVFGSRTCRHIAAFRLVEGVL